MMFSQIVKFRPEASLACQQRRANDLTASATSANSLRNFASFGAMTAWQPTLFRIGSQVISLMIFLPRPGTTSGRPAQIHKVTMGRGKTFSFVSSATSSRAVFSCSGEWK